jgi:hypothetical protein
MHILLSRKKLKPFRVLANLNINTKVLQSAKYRLSKKELPNFEPLYLGFDNNI